MDELSPRARALLAAAVGSDEPIPGDASRVRRGVLLRIGSAGFGATVFSLCLQRAQAFVSLAAPKLVTVVLVAVGGSAVYRQVQHRAELAPPSAPIVHVQRAALAVARLAPSSLTLVAAPAPSPVAAEPSAPEPRPQLVKARRKPAAVAPAGASGASELEAEMRWVRTADAALRGGDASAAQGLLDQHAHEFPNGALSEEREALRVVAACQSSPAAEARRAGARFLERAPHSMLAGRVRAACSPPPPAGLGGG